MIANRSGQSATATREEAYVSVDVETSGPIPGQFSLLAIGACLVAAPAEAFYIELQPISDRFIPDALRVSGLSLEQLRAKGRAPTEAMQAFRDWIAHVVGGRRPVFVGFNGCFDWAFINWYFHTFVAENPFGIGGIDIKSYYMGLTGCRWSETSSSQLPAVFRPVHQPTHNARDDAHAQAEIFAKLLTAPRQGRAE